MPPRHAKARKLYLSDEAIELLLAESVRSTYPMSVIVDMLIKRAYGQKQHAPEPEAKLPKVRRVYAKPEVAKRPAETPTQKKDFQFNG